MAHWLFKSEPSVFSFEKLASAGEKGTEWSGVRNHSAKLNMMAMKLGERGFFYHSNKGKAVVGMVEISRAVPPRPVAMLGKFGMVDIRAVEPLPKPVTLDAAKGEPRLAKMELVVNSRLSVQPVTDEEWRNRVRARRRQASARREAGEVSGIGLGTRGCIGVAFRGAQPSRTAPRQASTAQATPSSTGTRTRAPSRSPGPPCRRSRARSPRLRPRRARARSRLRSAGARRSLPPPAPAPALPQPARGRSGRSGRISQVRSMGTIERDRVVTTLNFPRRVRPCETPPRRCRSPAPPSRSAPLPARCRRNRR